MTNITLTKCLVDTVSGLSHTTRCIKCWPERFVQYILSACLPGWDQNDVYHDTQQVSGAAGTAGRGGESRPGGNSRQGSEQQPAVSTAGRGGEWRHQQATVGEEGGWQAED